MLRQPNFFHSQPSTLPKDAPAKFYLSTTFGLSFMISSVAYAYFCSLRIFQSPKSGTVTLNLKSEINLKERSDMWFVDFEEEDLSSRTGAQFYLGKRTDEIEHEQKLHNFPEAYHCESSMLFGIQGVRISNRPSAILFHIWNTKAGFPLTISLVAGEIFVSKN